MTTTRTGLRSGFYVLLRKPVQPAEPVTGCDSCDHGCSCEMGTPGCEHFGCWGTPVDDLTDTCPAVAAHIEHTLASIAYRNDLHAYSQQSHRR